MRRNNKSRRDLCNELNLKYTTVCDWVNARTIPREDQLEKLARYFDIKVGELFIEIKENDYDSSGQRMDAYLSGIRRLDMKVTDHMSDDQIRELIKSGYTFEHRTIEEYIEESGGIFVPSGEMDWGMPVGREIW